MRGSLPAGDKERRDFSLGDKFCAANARLAIEPGAPGIGRVRIGIDRLNFIGQNHRRLVDVTCDSVNAAMSSRFSNPTLFEQLLLSASVDRIDIP